jgi:hypothetical protein
MANWSSQRFQTLIHPEAATASRKSDEEKARECPCRLDALNRITMKPNIRTQSRLVLMQSSSCTTGGSPYTNVRVQVVLQAIKSRKPGKVGGVHVRKSSP